jgi:hypothetical protein
MRDSVSGGQIFELDAYYRHENNTGKAPNEQQNSIGLAVYFFLSMEYKIVHRTKRPHIWS